MPPKLFNAVVTFVHATVHASSVCLPRFSDSNTLALPHGCAVRFSKAFAGISALTILTSPSEIVAANETVQYTHYPNLFAIRPGNQQNVMYNGITTLSFAS